VDIGINLMPALGDHDWAFGNYTALGHIWQKEPESIVGRHVSLSGNPNTSMVDYRPEKRREANRQSSRRLSRAREIAPAFLAEEIHHGVGRRQQCLVRASDRVPLPHDGLTQLENAAREENELRGSSLRAGIDAASPRFGKGGQHRNY
jgi:hypothetical protein